VRLKKTRSGDATFELNLAPVLDIIVSIIPMLLLSVAFVQVKMIEAPTPQVVTAKDSKDVPKPETSITLRVSKKTGFVFEVLDAKGKASNAHVELLAGELDYNGLLASAIKLKESYPEVSKIQLIPDSDVPFDTIVKAMDQVRAKPRTTEKVSFSDSAIKTADIQYLFPDVVFSSIGG
jgi:biopolymer transport protein ExbD